MKHHLYHKAKRFCNIHRHVKKKDIKRTSITDGKRMNGKVPSIERLLHVLKSTEITRKTVL